MTEATGYMSKDLRVGVTAMLTHQGHTASEVEIAIATTHTPDCWFETNHGAWVCEDENGRPHHPLADEATGLADLLDVALTAIHRARALLATDGDLDTTCACRAGTFDHCPDHPPRDTCPSCQHPAAMHQLDGCWHAVTIGRPDMPCGCPCGVAREVVALATAWTHEEARRG